MIEPRSPGAPVKLHLGCGNVLIHGFINIDTRNLPGVLCGAVDDLRWLPGSGAPTGPVEMIYACHVLEHFQRRDTQRVLREWYRVLQPGGTLRLSVPDFDACVKAYRMGRAPLALLLGHLVGGQEYPENVHYMVFDYQYLSTLLSEVGFRRIRYWDWRRTEHAAYDDRSRGYFPHMDEGGILMSLNVECDK